jgi:hypothetical protein
MSAMSEQPIDPRRAYVIQFRRSLKIWKAKNLSDEVCIQQARLSAKRLHPLTESEQKDIDEFLRDELKPRAESQPSVGASEAIHVDYEME